MNEAVAACLRGEISPHVTLSRMLLGWANAADIRAALAESQCDNPRWLALAELAEGRWAEFDRLAAHIRRVGSDHSRLGGLPGIAAFFDEACGLSPEAGVALYSLGDPALLAAATAEMVAWLRSLGLLSPGAEVLDVGCGIGRVSAAISQHCGRLLGIDVAPAMVAEARRRHPALDFALSDGVTLPSGPWDLVLLADTMPYVLQAGAADRLVAAAMGELAAGGALVILNLSYGRGMETDEADARRWTARHQAALAVSRPFTLWDASAFVLRAPTAAVPGGVVRPGVTG